MTKCQHCDAEVLSTSQPSRMGTTAELVLMQIAAECHRAKWQFEEDFQPSKSAARALILQAAHELHRIGDLAIKARDALAAQPTAPEVDEDTLETLIREYARDLRRNSSGGDDYPWEIMKGVADYLDILIGRASPPEQPAAAPVICRDCGKREPCDDDCPNYVDQEVTSNNKESEDAARLDFIEQATKRSRTGVSFDWIPSVEGERSGYRFMRYHNIGEPRSNIRDVIDVAMAALSPTAAPEYQQEVHWSSSGEADAYDEASAATEQLEQVDAEDIWSNYCTEVAEENRSPQGALAFAVETVVEIIAGGLVANPAAATDITDEMVLAGAKAANPFAWDKGECTLEYSARQAMLDEIRQILTATLSPANKETQA